MSSLETYVVKMRILHFSLRTTTGKKKLSEVCIYSARSTKKVGFGFFEGAVSQLYFVGDFSLPILGLVPGHYEQDESVGLPWQLELAQ